MKAALVVDERYLQRRKAAQAASGGLASIIKL
jgi:hypothetical protein